MKASYLLLTVCCFAAFFNFGETMAIEKRNAAAHPGKREANPVPQWKTMRKRASNIVSQFQDTLSYKECIGLNELLKLSSIPDAVKLCIEADPTSAVGDLF